ncbi:MAG TPA: Maf family protein [Candidatus Bathyarchaeia archaeon]|nr:Maf family protein [Candidatus Bathyarchaeia archaeon]
MIAQCSSCMDNNKPVLLLGSKSASRQMLLKEAHIPFICIEQNADETACDWSLPLVELVNAIALHKMDHVVVPSGTQENEICFVLTADTMSEDKDGTIRGKPTDRADAIMKIKAARDGVFLCTAFCLDKKIWHHGQWNLVARINKQVTSEFFYYVPDEWIEEYLEKSWSMNASGAIAVEGYGGQFLKKVVGSYSTIVGLPLFELREAFEEISFFKKNFL